MSHNPYEAPQSADAAESQPEGFRWRLIPVALIGGFGAICLLGGIFGLVMMVMMSQVAPPESSTEAEVLSSEIADMFPVILAGQRQVFWRRLFKS